MEIDIWIASSIRGPRKKDGRGTYMVRVSGGSEWTRQFSAPIVGATGNESELFVLARAARYAARIPGYKDANIRVHTDSGYIVTSWYWVKFWKAAGWRNQKGRQIKHRELWEIVDELLLSRTNELIRDEGMEIGELRKAAEGG